MKEMKGLINKISVFNISTLALLLVTAFTLLSCNDANARKETSPADFAVPRPDDALSKLTRSLAD